LVFLEPDIARIDILEVALGALNVAVQVPFFFLDVTVLTVFQLLPVLIWIRTWAPFKEPAVFPETFTLSPATNEAGMAFMVTDDLAACAGVAISESTNAIAIKKLDFRKA
jgi:hypothetical protein